MINKRSKFKFRNPIKQNWSHIYALKEVLPEYQEVPFYSIIVLTGEAILKTQHNVRTEVIYPSMLYETILNHRGITKLKLQDIEKIYNNLKCLNLDKKKDREEHIKQINIIINEKKEEKYYSCPYCGKKLIKRDGQYGEFYGCSRFPRCKFTINVNEISNLKPKTTFIKIKIRRTVLAS